MQRDEPTLPESLDESLLRAGFATDDDSAGLIRQSLRATGARHRILALRAGVRRSLVSSDDWIDALGESESDVRREAVNLAATATIDDERVFAAIVHLLDDGDPLVVDGAGFALGEHRYIDAVVPLARIARDHDDARCRECAVAALGVLGDDRGRAAVLAALDDKAPVRRRAIVALTNFEGPDIDAALERASEDRDWQVRAAVDQLARDDDL
jgi:HEAT repeat protein